MNVLKKEKQALSAVATLAIAYIIISALVIFNVEPDTFDSFFDAIYWATVSLTTVGYGDIYPITITGKIMAIVISLLGAGAVAISAGFVEQYTKAQETGKESLTADLYIDIDSACLACVCRKSYNVQVSDRVTVFVHQDHTIQ